MRASTSIARS